MKNIIGTAKELIYLYIDKHIGGFSVQLSYYMLFTFFPVLLLANSVAGSVIPKSFEIPLSNLIPEPIRNFAMSYLGEIGEPQSSRLIFLGAVLTVYSLTRYIRSFRYALRSIYEKSRNMSFIADWVLSFMFSLGMLLLFYVAVFSVFFTDNLLLAVGLGGVAESLWYMLRFFIVALYAFFVICTLHFAECGSGEKFKSFAPGALCSVGLWTLISVVFSYYAREIANYSVVYGSIGNVIMLLVWLNITNTVLLMSAAFNICLNKKG